MPTPLHWVQVLVSRLSSYPQYPKPWQDGQRLVGFAIFVIAVSPPLYGRVSANAHCDAVDGERQYSSAPVCRAAPLEAPSSRATPSATEIPAANPDARGPLFTTSPDDVMV